MCALQADFLSHHLTHLFKQGWVPSAGLTDTRWENGRANGHVAVRRFLAEQQRNAEARVFYRVALHHVQQTSRFARMQTCFHRLP